MKMYLHANRERGMFMAALFITTPNWKPPKYPLVIK